MGIHYDYKSTRGAKAKEKQAKKARTRDTAAAVQTPRRQTPGQKIHRAGETSRSRTIRRKSSRRATRAKARKKQRAAHLRSPAVRTRVLPTYPAHGHHRSQK